MAARQYRDQRSTTNEPAKPAEFKGIRHAAYRRPGPPGYEWCDWEGVNNSERACELLDAELSPANPKPRFPILITGGVGLGKTGLAAVLYRIAKRPIWRRADSFLLDLSMGRNDDTYKNEIRKATEASLLVLDDLGVRKPSEGMFHLLFDVLEIRSGRPTVITTNKSLDELCSVYVDGRMYSRFAYGRVLQMTGTDRRLGDGGEIDVYQI